MEAETPDFSGKATRAIKFFSEHFATISASVTVFSSGISILLLFSYLSTFDSSLIWIVEYSDIIKTMIILIAVVSTYFVFIYQFVDTILLNRSLSTKWQIGLLLFMLSSYIYATYTEVDGALKAGKTYLADYNLIKFFAIVAFVLLVFMGPKLISSLADFKSSRFRFALFSICLTILIFGRAYGLYIRDVDSSYHTLIIRQQDGFLDEYSYGKIIFVTTHHIVFESGDDVFTVPSSEVVEIRTHINKTLPRLP